MVSRISRDQLQTSLDNYKKSLESSAGLPDTVTENNLRYDSGAGQLVYNMPEDLNESQFNENLPVNQAKKRVFMTYEISKIDTGRYVAGVLSGGDSVKGFTVSSDDLAGKSTSTSTVNKQWTKQQRKRRQGSDATKLHILLL